MITGWQSWSFVSFVLVVRTYRTTLVEITMLAGWKGPEYFISAEISRNQDSDTMLYFQ